jgi:hypothetical protein
MHTQALCPPFLTEYGSAVARLVPEIDGVVGRDRNIGYLASSAQIPSVRC